MNAHRFVIVCLALMVLITSCSEEESIKETVEDTKVVEVVNETTTSCNIEALGKPENLAQKFSYVYGYQQSQALLSSYDLDPAYIAKGVLDGAKMSGYFTEEEMQTIMYDYIASLKAQSDAELAKVQKENLKKAEDFLAVNAARKSVQTTESGLQYEILREGSGKKPNRESIVNVQYQLTLLSGEVVDSSYSRGCSSHLDLKSYLVTGFKEAVMLLKEGGKIRAWLHPSLGYGPYGSTYVQPNELLIFDIELLSIED